MVADITAGMLRTGQTAAVAAAPAAVPAAMLGKQAMHPAAEGGIGVPDAGCSRARPYARPSVAGPQTVAVTVSETVPAPETSAIQTATAAPPSAAPAAMVTLHNRERHATATEASPGSFAAAALPFEPAITAVKVRGDGCKAARTAPITVTGFVDGPAFARGQPLPQPERAGSNEPEEHRTDVSPIVPQVWS